MEIPQRLLKLILARRYQLTGHALESLDEDDLTLNDIVACLAEGRRRRSWPREHKYEIEGPSVTGRKLRVVARLIAGRLVRIITVYEIK